MAAVNLPADLASGRRTKRGFVMTGGGAKGLYEAGAMQAFHLSGMEFDSITGSSIGAINAIVYAEYLLRKRQLDGPPDSRLSSPTELEDHLAEIEQMDPFIRRFLSAWLSLPDLNIIDDKPPDSKLVRFVEDLIQFNLRLPDVVRLAWWLSDPHRPKTGLPPFRTLLSGLRLFWESLKRLGDWRRAPSMIRHLLRSPSTFVETFLPQYLSRFDMTDSLVDPAKAQELEGFFARPFAPLVEDEAAEDGLSSDGERETIMDSARTLQDYKSFGLDVRLTRANFRTGRLELSAAVSPEEFAVYLTRQAFRLRLASREGFPLGSHRLKLPGNPRAISAAIASGRFPGVFQPYPLEGIYPRQDARNELLYRMLEGWLADAQVAQDLGNAYARFAEGREDEEALMARWQLDSWKADQRLRDHFPTERDAYVDGGAIDNTPSNSAIDTIREWAYAENVPRNSLGLDLYVLLLHQEPLIQADEAADPNLYRVVRRTLDIQSAAKLTADSNTVETINHFGEKGEQATEALRVVLEALDGLDDRAKREVAGRVRDAARRYLLERSGGELGRGRRPAPFEALMRGAGEETLRHVHDWSRKLLEYDLPLQVDVVHIHPDQMSMDTLQFTERLGYRRKNALQMISMGCYNTMWDVRAHLETKRAGRSGPDAHDRRSLSLLRHWMAVADWPSESEFERHQELRQNWQCQRTSCVFHARHCAHGASITENLHGSE